MRVFLAVRLAPYLGPLGLSAIAVLSASAAANLVKALSFAPAEPVVLGFPIYQAIAGALAAAVAIGVARTAVLTRSLWRLKARALAFAVALLGLVLAVGDGTLSALAMIDARAGVQAGHDRLVAARASLDDQLKADRDQLAVLTDARLGDPSATVRCEALRTAQARLGIRPDCDWREATEGAITARRAALETAIAAASRSAAEIDAALAAGSWDVLPVWALVVIAAGAEVYVVVIFAGLARAAPKPKRAVRPATTAADGEGTDSARAPGWTPQVVPVRAHVRGNAPNGVEPHVRRQRNWRVRQVLAEAAASQDIATSDGATRGEGPARGLIAMLRRRTG